jgi:two-component system nitrate/nitrite response regulator NarL
MAGVGLCEVSIVVVVGDHYAIAEAVLRAINDCPELILIGAASGPVIGFDLIRCARPHVALVDVLMAGSDDGLAVASAVTERGLPTRVLMLSQHSDPAIIKAALKAGASGLLTKGATSSEITQSILDASGSSTVFPPVSEPTLLDSGTTDVRGFLPPAFELSRREAETLGLTSDGLGAKQIAWRLGVSEDTVRTFLKRAYCKLGAPNAAAAVAVAMRQGLLK